MSISFNNINKIISLVFLFSLLGQNMVGQDVFFPSNDSYTSKAESSVNFGNDVELKVKKSSTGNNDRYSYLSFDLTAISDPYEQVLLKLTSPNSSAVSILLESLTSPVDENMITWDNQPTNASFFKHGGLQDDNVLYYEVTDFINNAIASQNEVDLKLYSYLVTSSTQTFHSREAINQEDRPQLLCFSSTQVEMAVFEMKDVSVTSIEEDNSGSFASVILESSNDYEDIVDNYGGLVSCDHSYTATGYFRTEKIDDVWHLIDPLGNLFYMAGVNSVTNGGGVSLPDAMQDLGVNTLGSWSDKDIPNIAYCPELNIMRKFKNYNDNDPDVEATWDLSIVPVFEPNFEQFVQDNIQEWLAPYKNDPFVIGYFSDNELSFSGSQLEKSLELDPTNDQFIRADEYMKENYGNAYTTNQVTSDDELVYVRIVAGTYYEIVTRIIRQEDPNHLILGSRIHGNTRYRVPVIEEASQYNDVLSINYYREWEVQEADTDFWAEHSDIPWFTSEFYTKGDDVTGNIDDDFLPMDNGDGAGWLVPTQADRALHFENYVIKTMRDPNCVGHHWFRYLDNNLSNKGIYYTDADGSRKLYTELAESFGQINKAKYSLRDRILKGYTSPQSSCDSVIGSGGNIITPRSGDLDVYLVIGQSNTAGRGDIEQKDQTILENVFLFGESDWVSAENPMNEYSTIRKDLDLQGLSYAYTFGRTLNKAIGSQVGLVVNARGSTNIESWTKGSPEGYYEEALMRLQVALATEGSVLKGVLWHQGEADRNDANYFDVTDGDLVNLINDFRTDLASPDLPFIVGQLSQERADNATFNQNITTVASLTSNIDYVTTECLSTADGTHFDANGQRVLGLRYAGKVLELVYDYNLVTEKIYVNQDAHVRGGTNADTNYDTGEGDDALIRVKSASSNMSNVRNAFLKFDLTSIEGNIIDADLIIHGEIGGDTIGLHVYQTSTEWLENSITWNNSPVLSELIQTDTLVTSITEDLKICLSEFIEEELNGNDLVSVGMESNGAYDNQLKFTSHNDLSNLEKHPYLLVTHIVKNDVVDCNLDINGTALVDSCGICSGGETGIPVDECLVTNVGFKERINAVHVYPNLTNSTIHIKGVSSGKYELLDNNGIKYKSGQILSDDQTVNLKDLTDGIYFIKIIGNETITVKKVVKRM